MRVSTPGATEPTIRDRIDDFARRSPARLAMIVFALIILFFTSLLLLPFASDVPGSAGVMEALWTATSAVCVTGLTVVDTATYWSGFGRVVIAIAMQVGGLGVMTLASILGLAVSRHIGLTQRMLTATETKSRLGEVGSLLRAVLATSLIGEGILFLVFIPSLISRGLSALEAVGHSLFLSVSVFNNGGFVIWPDGMEAFAGDWFVCLPIILGTFVGAIGFPVVLNIASNRGNIRAWSLHTKITLVAYFLIWIIGVVLFALLEWGNTATIGNAPIHSKVLSSMFEATMPRSTGLSVVDASQMNESTWFMFDIMMFIGGGSASTSGGIKVSTFAVLLLAILAEARGDRDTEAFGKRIPPDVVRLGISATFLGAFMVGTATLLLLQLTDVPLDKVLFEVISAFATCGLSTGITADLPTSAKAVLIVMMYLGRVGTMTFAAALALRNRRRVLRLPVERPIIG
ncbi:Trk-type K+ transport system membrane component [Arcanobacterium wilhelmae]|uniref:Trk-type K+ transport system membrane component n=1 Tax=Arcanobacterium wilhelmae TaxID=1803177 RepID=A0ABT9NA35_9ACTO|nr:potassium transporter TrkG [Arcanobacterium wilhelmae]MDP9800577.1 Trk-type K+ transport system membrane component [Arcanobacterium wilhelmae]WFN89991.1 potassium transporter TrkG [Arcanobacterium wilhelmae]